MAEQVSYTWRGPLTDDEMVDLVESHGGAAVSGRHPWPTGPGGRGDGRPRE